MDCMLAVLRLAAAGLSLVVTSGGCPLAAVPRPLIAVASFAAEHGSRAHRLQHLWHSGLAAPRHMESSWARD